MIGLKFVPRRSIDIDTAFVQIKARRQAIIWNNDGKELSTGIY